MPVKPKPVKVEETGKVYTSAREAARDVQGDYSKIYRCLRGERKTHKGLHYEYADKE